MEARHPDKTFHFLMERSCIPNYERINRAFKNALEELGHRVTLFDPSQFESSDRILQYFLSNIVTQDIDYWFITSNSLFLASYLPEKKSYLFELVDAQLIFIHHDDISSKFSRNFNPITTFQFIEKIKDRSIHFCIEYANFLDLRFLGLERVYKITHGSEFKPINSPEEKSYTVSFVGHILPQLGNAFDSFLYSHLLEADFWTRLVKLDKKLKPSAVAFANQMLNYNKDSEFFDKKFSYISSLNLASNSFRGELLTRLTKRLKSTDIDIFCKDREGLLSDNIIGERRIKYHPAITDCLEAQSIYANSKINLNITGLKFDDAVVNRVIDVGAVGGFILTDWKPGLQDITSVHQEISYRTIDELGYKINYYLSHEAERVKIAEQLHQDITSNCTYSHVVNFILAKITQMPAERSTILRLDLGCGAWKPEGYVGVDIYPWPEVDVIADLNQNFPFPDNCVDEVRAHDAIEHLQDRIHTMNEIWRICKANAIVDINVPSTDGRGAFQDPTHVSFWNINSFPYYCVEFPDYINLCRSYGFQGAFRIIRLEQVESPGGVIHVRAILQVVKEDQLSENLIRDLDLRKINLIVFPDWSQPEELVFSDLTDVIRELSLHQEQSQIKLLIDTTKYPNSFEIEPELILSNILINLSVNENLNIPENGLEVSLIAELNEKQWEDVSKKIYGRVIPNKEDAETIEGLKLATLKSIKVDEIANLSFTGED